MRWLFAYMVLLVALPCQAQPDYMPRNLSNPMVADISQNAIEIRTSFNGAQLLIFGARNVPGDLVVAVRGPQANILLRRKERIAGMWMHVSQHKYFNLPLFYALTSTKPLQDVAPPHLLQALGLGKDAVTYASHTKSDALFDTALDINLTQKNWWQQPSTDISYFGESLFKARIDFPDSLPGGDYTAEVYLFTGGELRAMQTIPITVYKTGLEAYLVKQSQEQELVYGLVAILMALTGGWLAHRLFHRT